MAELTKDFELNQKLLATLLGEGRNYDLVSRSLRLGGRKARLWVIDGYGQADIIERMTAFWLSLSPEQVAQATDAQQFSELCLSCAESMPEQEIDTVVTAVLLGKLALLVEGYDCCFLMDAKRYPGRSIQEPSDGRVLRGAHDGFVETLVQNTALLRRRIRDPRLTLENHKIGEKSRTDVVIAYMEGLADETLLTRLRTKLAELPMGSYALGQESVAESMMEGQWYNPFPRVRYTERPDKATACLMEGDIVMFVDNSPAAMILPTSFFDFVQETNDYYFPPLVGNYFRLLRVLMMPLTLVITPLWYLLVNDPGIYQSSWRFLAVKEPLDVPLLVQLLLVEFFVDLLKLASLNTPDVLSNSFSMLGALILGDCAVEARWLVPEVLVYMAFVAIANFVQPSYELSYAFKLLRVALLLCSAAFGWWGFGLGIVGVIVLLFTTKPLLGTHYLYPLYPFHWPALKNILLRRPISKENT